MPIQAELDDKQTVCEPDQSLFFFFVFFSFRSYKRKMYISLLPTDENGRCNADADYVFCRIKNDI